MDPNDRQKLVDTGIANLPSDHTDLFPSPPLPTATPTNDNQNIRSPPPSPLPGVSSTWIPLEGASAANITDISRRIIALHQLLGGKDDIDIVWMIERAPGLLTADFRNITRRLLELRTSKTAVDVDVVKLAEKEPSLLLEEGSASSSSDDDESVAQQLMAWSHGLLNDGDSEWSKRAMQLKQYIAVHGDAHVGYRENDDDPGLARWARKQRKEKKEGTLSEERMNVLLGLNFEFDPETAEWLRWYNQLRKFEKEHGHCNPVPLAAGSGKCGSMFVLNSYMMCLHEFIVLYTNYIDR